MDQYNDGNVKCPIIIDYLTHSNLLWKDRLLW
jgi:hypothetical protein